MDRSAKHRAMRGPECLRWEGTIGEQSLTQHHPGPVVTTTSRENASLQPSGKIFISLVPPFFSLSSFHLGLVSCLRFHLLDAGHLGKV